MIIPPFSRTGEERRVVILVLISGIVDFSEQIGEDRDQPGEVVGQDVPHAPLIDLRVCVHQDVAGRDDRVNVRNPACGVRVGRAKFLEGLAKYLELALDRGLKYPVAQIRRSLVSVSDRRGLRRGLVRIPQLGR
ncbi:hypothetical protein P5G50_10550 [Leifsonia sp. F6_8S_P_1B]|uniref:Uncharacterized protein n=1 Tax=Leifsonia williamsii TaxID=3035919 RepID=A0ABT8KBR7_9MICO|nr:hypothetical protein [Leifsonia williamsii]MDN4614890.1 hypothetical protein [Leifsonia williamsii]